MKLFKILLIITFFNCASMYPQTMDKSQIHKIKVAISDFFISKGEIDKVHLLDVKAIHINDSTDIGYHKKGIYVIRAVYRTDGNDYLFYLNENQSYEITDFKDLKLIISKATKLYSNSTDEELFQCLKRLLKWYEEDYLLVKRKRYTTKKK